MIVLRRLLTLLVTLAFGVGVIALAPASAQERHIEASLAFETRTPKPGESVTLAIRMKPESGWHGYPNARRFRQIWRSDREPPMLPEHGSSPQRKGPCPNRSAARR